MIHFGPGPDLELDDEESASKEEISQEGNSRGGKA
jgi:hypothetical protein